MAERQGLGHKPTFVLQQTIDYFDNFWKSQRVWQPHERISIFERLPIPYWSPARPDPALNENNQAVGPVGRGRHVPFYRATRSDAGSGNAIQGRMMRFFQRNGYTFVKILGAGSQGVAALFEFAGQRLVIKWSEELPALVTEMWAMKKMAGARHVVQVSECSQLLVPSSPQRASSSQTFLSARLKPGLAELWMVLTDRIYSADGDRD